MIHASSTQLRRIIVAAVLLSTFLFAVPTPPAFADEFAGLPPASILVNGKGNGHGRGMSQYGALGWATTYSKTWQEILDFYYGGTTLSPLTDADADLTPNGVMSVRLTALDNKQTAMVSENASLLLENDPVPGRKWAALVVREIAGTVGTYRVWGSTTPTCVAEQSDPVANKFVLVADIAGPTNVSTTLSNDASAAVMPNDAIGICEPAGATRYYRGTIRAVNGTDKENRTVNLVKLDDYLRGVVPRESPASWGDLAGGAGMNALRAQAVAARSYSLGQKRYSYAKTCDTQSCQVYGGAALREKIGRPIAVLEDMRTNTAISDTSGFIMRTAKGGVVSTEFTSSNGGRTAGTTFPMRVDDGDIAADSSDLNWSAVIDAKSIQKKYPSIGVLLSVVTTHDGLGSDWNGYATKVTISGTAGVVSVGGWDFKSAFALRSPWYETTPVYGSTSTSTVVGPMLFIGDSVGESITSEFNSIVRPAYPNVDYQAQSSRCLIGASCTGAPDGITIINSLPADKTPAIAVIQLGYNDSSSTFGAEADQVVAALTAKGVQRIIFINMSTRRTTAGYDVSNTALANIAATHANVTLFDWNTYSSDTPRWRWFVKNDNVHLTATGQTEFALYIRAQLDALRAQGLLPQTPGAPDVVIGLPLRTKHRGDMVKLVQKSLNAAFKLKKKAIPTDGIFGKSTRSLVKRYETAMALPVDGVVDIEVWKSLGLDKKPRTSVLRLGAKHPSVKVLQATLNRVLKITLKTSGYYDRPTKYYVKQFQQRAKLRATGNVNRATWLALMTTADRL